MVWRTARAVTSASRLVPGASCLTQALALQLILGQRGYGALLGRLAMPQFVTKAVAPFALALMLTVDPSRMWA